MAKSRAYFDRYRIGTTLVGMPESMNRSGGAAFVGLDRVQAGFQHLNPNFALIVQVIAALYNSGWTQRDLYNHFRNLHRAIMDHADTYGKGWLVWVDSDEETTTTSNNESAGSGVVIEVASLGALSIAVDDYVLAIPPATVSPLDLDPPAEVLKVTAAGGGAFTAETLVNDLPSGSTLFRVFIAYPDAVFQAADLGAPVEQAQDTFRFVTNWNFGIGGTPVKSGAYSSVV